MKAVNCVAGIVGAQPAVPLRRLHRRLDARQASRRPPRRHGDVQYTSTSHQGTPEAAGERGAVSHASGIMFTHCHTAAFICIYGIED